jgi:hypothetical protein
VHQNCTVFGLGFERPTEGNRMALRHI